MYRGWERECELVDDTSFQRVSINNTKETYLISKESYPFARETCFSAKEPDLSTKETYLISKESYLSAKETYFPAKEPDLSTKESCLSAKERGISTS